MQLGVPHAPILTFVSPWGVLVPVLGMGGVLEQLGLPMHLS